MEELKSGEYIVDILKDPTTNTADDFQRKYKPKDLTIVQKDSDVEVEIKKEKMKEYVKQLNSIKTNLKKVYSLIYGNCIEGVQAMLKADK